MLSSTRRLSFTTFAFLAALCPDSTAQCEVKLTASDADESDYFGTSVAFSGDTALIGARGANNFFGGAYVFVRSGAGWDEQAELVASDGLSGDWFGGSVAVDGDTALVGAFLNSEAGSNAGAAYVFVRTGTSWSEQVKLTASDTFMGDYFGASVALSGDTALIGVPRDDDAANNSGSAWVFVRSGTSWSEQAKLTGGDLTMGDRFGSAVAVSGDTAVIGSIQDDDGGTSSGSAYVFVRTGTLWSEQAKLTASDGATEDFFGTAVSIAGDTVLVGAPRDDDPVGDAGSAYVFVRSGTSWTEQAKLGGDPIADAYFGNALSVSGDWAVVGAPFTDDGGAIAVGAAYVFDRSGTIWSAQATLMASDRDDFDSLGNSVALSGDSILAGAFLDEEGGNSAGSAYVYDLESPTDIGTSYCATSANSVGPGMLISATGSLSRSAECVTLEAAGGPDDKFGIFFFGPNQLAGAPFGEGLRCVGGATQRVQPPAETGPTNGNLAGTATRELDFSLPYGAGITVAPPLTNFQYWYRDPMGGPAGFNTSDALEIGFTP